MKFRYVFMLAVTIGWFIVAFALIIMIWIYGEDWFNPTYMRAYFSSAPIPIFFSHMLRKRKIEGKLFREKK